MFKWLGCVSARAVAGVNRAPGDEEDDAPQELAHFFAGLIWMIGMHTGLCGLHSSPGISELESAIRAIELKWHARSYYPHHFSAKILLAQILSIFFHIHDAMRNENALMGPFFDCVPQMFPVFLPELPTVLERDAVIGDFSRRKLNLVGEEIGNYRLRTWNEDIYGAHSNLFWRAELEINRAAAHDDMEAGFLLRFCSYLSCHGAGPTKALMRSKVERASKLSASSISVNLFLVETRRFASPRATFVAYFTPR